MQQAEVLVFEGMPRHSVLAGCWIQRCAQYAECQQAGRLHPKLPPLLRWDMQLAWHELVAPGRKPRFHLTVLISF